MTVAVVAHLNFKGRAEEALEFYASVFGGEKTVVTYADAGAPAAETESAQVMWGQLKSEMGFIVYAYDVPSNVPYERGINSFFMSVRGNSMEEIKNYWNKLSEEATVLQELGPAAWSPLYGMVRDKFDIVWVLDIEHVDS